MDGKKRLILTLTLSLGVIVALSVSSVSLVLVGCSKASEKAESSETLMATGATAEPGDPEHQKAAIVNIELGLGYLAQGQVARAKNKLTHAAKLAPDIAEPHSALAYFFERVGETKEAHKEHKKAIRLGNGKGAVYNNYGAFLCRQNKFKEADLAFQKAFLDKEYARTAEVFENAGICSVKADNLEAASQYLKTALLQDPKRTNAMLELTSLRLKQGQLGEARNYLTQYKQISEPTARSLWLGIQLSHEMGDKDGVASQALILKNLFEESNEYQTYLKSDIGKT